MNLESKSRIKNLEYRIKNLESRIKNLKSRILNNNKDLTWIDAVSLDGVYPICEEVKKGERTEVVVGGTVPGNLKVYNIRRNS